MSYIVVVRKPICGDPIPAKYCSEALEGDTFDPLYFGVYQDSKSANKCFHDCNNYSLFDYGILEIIYVQNGKFLNSCIKSVFVYNGRRYDEFDESDNETETETDSEDETDSEHFLEKSVSKNDDETDSEDEDETDSEDEEENDETDSEDEHFLEKSVSKNDDETDSEDEENSECHTRVFYPK